MAPKRKSQQQAPIEDIFFWSFWWVQEGGGGLDQLRKAGATGFSILESISIVPFSDQVDYTLCFGS